MNLRSSGGTKRNLVAMAAGVAAAEVASIMYYILTPWFLSPGNRGLYTSIGFNILLFILIHRLVECVPKKMFKSLMTIMNVTVIHGGGNDNICNNNDDDFMKILQKQYQKR